MQIKLVESRARQLFISGYHLCIASRETRFIGTRDDFKSNHYYAFLAKAHFGVEANSILDPKSMEGNILHEARMFEENGRPADRVKLQPHVGLDFCSSNLSELLKDGENKIRWHRENNDNFLGPTTKICICLKRFHNKPKE